MKYFFVLFLFIFSFSDVYSQDVPTIPEGKYFDKNGLDFTFSENGRINGIKNGNSELGVYNGNYHIVEENSINYLVILWDDKTWDKYLMIAYEYISNISHVRTLKYINLYNEDGYPFFCMGTIPAPESRTYRPYTTTTKGLTSTSMLIEGATTYSTDNLDERIGICWAEGVSGYGIGEKIIFQTGMSFNTLFISIGYVSIEKPYLYNQNSRAKKIRVSYEGENPQIFELADTPNFQAISGRRLWWPDDTDYPEKDLWIEILEVYPGTKYTDTCINSLAWYFAQ